MNVYLLPTPIVEKENNYLSAYSLSLFKSIRFYFVENPRTARRFISSLNLGINLSEYQFFTLSKNTSAQELLADFESIPEGEDIGLMSEAGCPGIADPGSELVKLAHKKSISVVPVVGPSSIVLSLMASGLNGQSFTFHGYLPINKVERKKKILSLESIARKTKSSQIFIETPYRNLQLLEDLKSICNDDTLVCVAANITGENQFIKTQTVKLWKKEIPAIHKVPVVFIIGY